MALSDYSDMEKEILDAEDPRPLPKGTEVKARIIKVNSGNSDKNGANWYSVVFDVPSDPLCPPFSDFFWDPADHSKLDPKFAQMNMSKFKNFVKAFGIDLSKPFSWEDDLPRMEGFLIVGQKTSEEYGTQNSVSKYSAGK